MKITKIILVAAVFLLGIVYLWPSAPATPDLTPATRSAEPGDTWQHPDQKGFYSNLSRSEVISQMQSKYSLTIFGLKIPSFRLNYRPEDAFALVRDQTKSNYLEEIVYPMRDSLFVNGWEPANAPVYANTPKDMIPKLFYENVAYLNKITLKPNHSSLAFRIIVWTLIFPATYLVYLSLKKSLQNA